MLAFSRGAFLRLMQFEGGWPLLLWLRRPCAAAKEHNLERRRHHQQHDGANKHASDDDDGEGPLDLTADPRRDRGRQQSDASR